jgi:hypothetical protein
MLQCHARCESWRSKEYMHACAFPSALLSCQTWAHLPEHLLCCNETFVLLSNMKSWYTGMGHQQQQQMGGFNQQGMPPQGMPPQGMPPPGYPQPGMQPPGMPPQFNPNQPPPQQQQFNPNQPPPQQPPSQPQTVYGAPPTANKPAPPAPNGGAAGRPAGKGDAGAHVYLVYDDEEVSMEEKRCMLPRYRFDENKMARLQELESRLGHMGQVLGM